MKKTFFTLLCLAGMALTGSAQTDDTVEVSVINEVDTVWNFGYKGVNLFSRQMHRIDIAYPSTDQNGEDVTLSGYVCIPSEIYSGAQPCDGILLYNHYTQTHAGGAPTRGYSVGEDFVMANPLKPNYIVVCSDYLGFGITEGRNQVFCFGDANGQASIDCLLAARQLLDNRGISQGRFTINAGYSSGGYDALGAQRVRDMKYRDQVQFHKTLVGGMPFDVMSAYRTFIDWQNDASVDATCLPMVLDVFNREGKLGYTYDEMFKEPLASKFEKWFLSGQYPMAAVMDSMEGVTLAECVQEKFLDRSSEEFQKLKELATAHSLTNGWTPDSTQRYFSMHLLRDSVVPVQSGRAFINFLTDFDYDGQKCQGYKRSIIPERTRLQTNYFLPLKQHTIAGGMVFYLTLAATLTATPVLYYDGELNTHYADLVEPATLMGIIHLLEEKGIDVKGTVQQLMASDEGSGASSGGFFSFMLSVEEKLKSIGTSTAEVLQILLDSGIEMSDILEAYDYFTSEASEVKTATGDADQKTAQAMEPFLTDYYQHSLLKWLRENNVNIFEDND